MFPQTNTNASVAQWFAATEKSGRKVHYHFFDCLPELQKGPEGPSMMSQGATTPAARCRFPHLRPACSPSLFCPPPANTLPMQYHLLSFLFAEGCKQRAKKASLCVDYNSVVLESEMRVCRSWDGRHQIGELRNKEKRQIFSIVNSNE